MAKKTLTAIIMVTKNLRPKPQFARKVGRQRARVGNWGKVGNLKTLTAGTAMTKKTMAEVTD